VLPFRHDNVSVSFPSMPPAEAGTTRIQLCGRLKADVEGRHVTPALRGRQGRVLLAYLVLNRGRPVSRDELISAIWPDAPPIDPAAALRTQLSRLRAALGSEALAGRDTVELKLPDSTWIDIEAAERAIRVADSALKAGDWKDAWAHAHIALNIAGRPFLAGFEAPWVEEVRRELEELELRAREVIARAGIGLGGSELAGAERSARALIRAAPFRESGYLNLMRALVASGNTAEALRTYDELRKLLAEELGSAPGAEIQALHRRLLGGGRKPPSPEHSPLRGDLGEASAKAPLPSGPAAELPLPTWVLPRRGVPFVGRTEELALLSGLWVETRHGTRHIVLVGGDPGVGKTRLVTEFAHRAHDGGAAVLYGRADEEATLTYQPFIEALRHWAVNTPADELQRDLGPNASVLGSLVPEIAVRLPGPAAGGSGEVVRDRLFDAVTGTLAAIASHRPTVLVIDDLQWADPGSLLMLRHIARSVHRGGLMVLATYRETEPSPALAETIADLGRERLFERMHLAGLSSAEVVEMVASLRGDGPEPELAGAIHEDTGGNPFLVEALVNQMGPREDGQPAPRREAIYARGIPQLVREAVAHRVGELGPGVAEALDVASVIGREFEAELIVEVGERPSEEVTAALEAAVAAGLLTDVPGTLDHYAFSHALFRQTVYAGIPKRLRTALHGRLADALERRHGSDPRHVSELARHYAGAGPAAAPKALEYCVRAGASALGALAFEEAVKHYNGALSALNAVGSSDENLRCELLIALGEAEWRAGDVGSSRETFGRAARIAGAIGDAETLGRAALGFCGFGWERYGAPDTEAINLLRSALAKGRQPDSLRARLLARLAAILQFAGRSGEATELSAEALDIARAGDDEEALAAALIGRWHARSGPDGLEERVKLTRQLSSLAETLHNRDLEMQALMLRVIVSLELGDFTEVDVAIAEHARLADRMKQSPAQIHSRAFQAMRALMEGRYEDVERLAADVLELGTLSQASSAVQASGIELFALYWEQDRLDELEQPVRDLVAGYEGIAAWRVALAFLLSGLGRAEEAQAELDELAAGGFAAIPDDATRLGSLGFLALTAAALGDSERMEELEGLLAPYRGRPIAIGGAAAYGGTTSFYLGVLAARLGRHDAAVERLEEAAALNQRGGALPWLARSRYELTRALAARGEAGDAERAGKLLAEAGRAAERLGMAALLKQMRAGEGRESLSRKTT
jgi:DNA-binding SARP family transcriptional activator/tetratricopeptide (TPR) repeat protein